MQLIQVLSQVESSQLLTQLLVFPVCSAKQTVNMANFTITSWRNSAILLALGIEPEFQNAFYHQGFPTKVNPAQ